ncbi:LOW QUALITY PROTEIN: hypothetical protein CFC21_000710 [Triticum aestivum]|uniref:F-box domain-containing protein n=1 Tax=Triticum aestivum TaxID=4565 RepID=A0A3B5XUZ3_WHEAT|nr:LOW QUALITY PROTEIN: hypothetical protein CFC21_000710 [Triticum aestivum]
MSSRSVARRRRRKRSPLSSRSLARRRRRRRSSRSLVARAPLPDNDDLLEEILLRLRPSSLPRASAVCKRWRRLVADPRFLDRFCAHHRKPPLLGFFEEIVVWTPMTGEQRCVAVPPLFKKSFLNGAVLCTTANKGHVHGACQFSHFKVVLVCKDRKEKKLLAFVYSSDTGVWGNLISIEVPSHIRDTCTHGSLVGNAFYWLLSTKDGILKFDLDMQSLALIKGPPVANNFCRDRRRIIQTENGVVGLAILYYPHLEIWQMKTVKMCTVLGLPPQIEEGDAKYMAYSEDIDAIFIYVNTNVYMVELKLMQSKRLHEGHHINNYHPFTSLYTPGDYSYLVFILQE